MRRLTQELELTQARLRTVREESDAANEELRAANEELQSINEEYRSTSEELETSKEELQSINEELQTVNSELKLKLEAVSRAHSDLQNLMAATDFGTLFLDSGLRIKRFTERVTDLFSITPKPTRAGRSPISPTGSNTTICSRMRARCSPILRRSGAKSAAATAVWYDMRLRPYRTADDKIDGVVITFVDVSERTSGRGDAARNEEQLQQEKHLIDLSRDPIFVWDFDAGIVEWNRGSEELYGYQRDEALGKGKEQLLRTSVPGSSFAELKAKLLEGRQLGRRAAAENQERARTIGRKPHRAGNLQWPPARARKHPRRHRARAAERRLQLLLGELTHRVRNTLAVIQAIARHTLRNSQSKEDFVERFEGRLSALAAAHTLLVGSDWKGADLAELARQQLAPYITDNPDRCACRATPVSLAGRSRDARWSGPARTRNQCRKIRLALGRLPARSMSVGRLT